MGMLLTCSHCGHKQMIGENPIDGRIKWWTTCEKCKKGDFMTKPDIEDLFGKRWKKKGK